MDLIKAFLFPSSTVKWLWNSLTPSSMIISSSMLLSCLLNLYLFGSVTSGPDKDNENAEDDTDDVSCDGRDDSWAAGDPRVFRCIAQ